MARRFHFSFLMQCKRPAGRWMTLLVLCAGLLATKITAAAEPRIVASIPPIHSLASMVMSGGPAPELLVTGGVSPHAHALRPSQARLLTNADLVIWIGPMLEGFLARTVANLTDKARVLTLANAPGMVHRSVRPGHGGESKHHDHDHRHHGSDDPHYWLDPRNAVAMVRAIARALGRVDPANADRYGENARAAARRLVQLETEIDHGFENLKTRAFVVYHDAFRHFEARFGLRSIGAVALDADRPPGAAHVQGLRQKISQGDVICVFTEPQLPAKLIRSLVRGSRTKTGILDPLGSGFAPGPELYIKLMESNARALKNCLSP